MNAELFLQSFNAALDAIAQREFDFTQAQDLLPSGRLLSIFDRLEVVRRLDLKRPEFRRKVDFQIAAEFDVTTEAQELDEAMKGLIQELLGVHPTREKLVALGADKLDAMDVESPHFELRDQLHADLASNDITGMTRAIRHLPIRSEEFAELISEDLSELPHEFRKWQLAHRLETYQAAKSHLAEAWFGTTILFALHYADHVPVRDLVIAGLSGLAKGTEMFDGKRGYTFGSYASWWVQAALTRANIELRGWTVKEVHIYSEMQKLIGKERWKEWVQNPNPQDVPELGLDDQTVIKISQLNFDKAICPIHLKGKYLTPECAGIKREWVQLSENVTSETNPFWWV